ncbi:branched-chain amino acid ABC transporter substrate-binding protein [Siculibacillus lacustris]|uniref:Branched-chain amino acid ABC transporter substrate-binding protein n=1 Tax=Siculibacillus lacustris TaxID=1549641 RepID=A0A4Q9VJH3_9HYPH|nr:branched-chain amino acid ABC transporter substrate-binding protein [Siculibacillus lacustris]TBW35485.1 branched-chain amino acid ABC transporter substrate-binding protein [Siculibacillus lacustris]
MNWFGSTTLAASLVVIACAPLRAETLGPVTDELGVVKILKGQPILIGGYASQSGGDTNQGIAELHGAELALKDFGGKVRGFPVKFNTEDAQCTAEGGQTAATKLAANRQLVAVVGPSCSSGARVGAPILWNLGIPSIGIGATAPGLTATDRPAGFKGFLRVVPNDLKSAEFQVDWVRSKLGLGSVATIHDGSPYTEQLVRAFEKDFVAKGGKVVASEAIGPSDNDLRPVLTRIAGRKPDLIFTPVFVSSTGFLLRQKGEVAGLKDTPVLGGEGVFSANIIEAAGPAVIGFRIVGPSTEQFSQRFPSFVKAFETEFGEAPTGGFSAWGYDAMLVALKGGEAVAKADADGNLYIGRKALRDALFATRDLPGLTGKLTCSAEGDCGASIYAIWEFADASPTSFAPGTNPKKVFP